MDRRVADSDAPDLGVRMTSQEPLACGKDFLGNLEAASVHVDGNDLSQVAGFDKGANLLLVEIGTSAGEFLNRVAPLP
jgi:hypothetical protein